MIPSEYKSRVIHNGIEFIRVITEAYGSEKGMELWDQIANVLDPDVKGDIFFAMLTGDRDTITISGTRGGSNKITLIKTLREVTLASLRDAKDSIDHLNEFHKPITIKLVGNMLAQREAFLGNLRDAGFII
jgi:hypothetical protein